MNPNLLDINVRKQIIKDIKSAENQERKKKSIKDFDVYNDNAYPYVYDELAEQLSARTADQMPIIANLNIAKTIVNKEATIYTDKPVRNYSDITESDKEVLELVYSDCGFNSGLSKANKYFKLRNQAFLQIVPKDQKLKLRVVHGHNIDIIPDSDDPETAYAYIMSSFDKVATTSKDGVNQSIADQDDYQASLEKYQVWTNELVLTMDGKGNLLTEVLDNPIRMVPFIDIAKDKDFEFFVRIGQALTDFTIDFNVAWSDLMYISRMQGYSVGVLTGDANLKPDSMTIGPNKLLFLPSNPANPDSKLELDFKNPQPNIEASLKAIESLISTFLTTRGLDSKAIQVNNSGNTGFSSALERLLSMIDQFRATKDDFDLFYVVEKKLHKIVVAYLSLLTGTKLLPPEYGVSAAVLSSKVDVVFAKPEMVETMAEKLDNASKRLDLGITDQVLILQDIDSLSIDQATEQIAEINKRRSEQVSEVNNGLDQNEAQ